MEMEERIIELLEETNRKGMESMIEWLQQNNYFTAMGSKTFHGNYPGGLMEHSWNLYVLFIEIIDKFSVDVPDDTQIICAILHDVVKCHMAYNSGKQSPQGHGKYSLRIVKEFIVLTPLEEAIIEYHMGMYGCASYYDQHELSEVQKVFNDPIIKLFYFCDDMVCQFVDEKKGGKLICLE